MWCIDSWAVLDGLAFASLRKSDSIAADATVFLSVPDLEPVPVGRISTALRAQRSCFQDGFRDPDNGREFEFDNLEQIREVIRRAYLGGGLAPVPVPVEGPPPSAFRRELEQPPQPPQPRTGGEYYEAALERLGRHGDGALQDLRPLTDNYARGKLLQEIHGAADILFDYLQAFGTATMIECMHSYSSRLHLPGPRETLGKWRFLLIALGFWDNNPPEGFEADGFAKEIWLGYDRQWIYSLFDKDILFRIPSPLRANWDRRIQTLGHKLLLPLVHRHYFLFNNELPELIPALFCAMVVVVSSELTLSGIQELRRADFHRLLGRACEWLNMELPRVELPPAIEQAISNFAWNQLGLNRAR